MQCVFFFFVNSIAVFVCGQPHLLTLFAHFYRSLLPFTNSLLVLSDTWMIILRILTMNSIGKQAKIFTKRNSHTNRTLQQHTYIHIIILSNSHPLFLCHSALFFDEQIILHVCFKHSIDSIINIQCSLCSACCRQLPN